MTLILSSLYFQETYKSGATQNKPITLSKIPTQSLQPIASYYATRNKDTLELSGTAQGARVGLKPLNILLQSQGNANSGGLKPLSELQQGNQQGNTNVTNTAMGGLRPLNTLMSQQNIAVQDNTKVVSNKKPVTNTTTTSINKPTTVKRADNVQISAAAKPTNTTTTINASSISAASKVDVVTFVDKSEADSKIDIATEKIKNWSLKITSLEALVKYQSMNGEAFIDGGKQLTKARGDALDARIDATKSVNEAISAINNLALTTGFVNGEHDVLINDFRKMENYYEQTEKKNTDILTNVKDYLTSSLTSSLVQIGKAFDIVSTGK